MSRGRRKPANAIPGNPSPPSPAGRRPAFPGRRLWLFRGVLVMFPFLFLVLLELLLRAIGYGVSMDFVRRQDVEGEPR